MEVLKPVLFVTVTSLAVVFLQGMRQVLLREEESDIQEVIQYIRDAHKQEKASLSQVFSGQY
jgi:hypothetical protein